MKDNGVNVKIQISNFQSMTKLKLSYFDICNLIFTLLNSLCDPRFLSGDLTG